MALNKFGFMTFITALTLISSCSGQEDEIGEGLFIDGPGGYLPDIEDGIDVDSVDFAQTPSIDEEDSVNQLLMYGNILSIFDYWKNYLGLLLVQGYFSSMFF
jgi:hypothetical protein